jgi:hypothetical protein
MAKKLSKDAVDYENPAKYDAHCAECEHFEKPNVCEIVAGRISPRGWCRRYKRAGAAESRKKKHTAHLIILLGSPKER